MNFDFDAPVRTRQAQMLSRVYRHARSSGASSIRIEAHRGGVLLSDGERLLEREDTADLRAAQLADLLVRAGIDEAAVRVRIIDSTAAIDGENDWKTRAAVVYVEQ